MIIIIMQCYYGMYLFGPHIHCAPSASFCEVADTGKDYRHDSAQASVKT